MNKPAIKLMETQDIETANRPTVRRRFADAVTMFLVSVISLVLLIYVAFGEAQRTYQQFHVEKLEAQGRVVQTAMAKYLRAGLPLSQYVGFASLSERILESDPAIASMMAFGQDEQPVFVNGDKSVKVLPGGVVKAESGALNYEIRQSKEFLQVILPLQNRFENIGGLAVTMPRSVVTEQVIEGFKPLLVVAAVLSVAFGIFVYVGGPKLSGKRTVWLQVAYAMTFLTMAVAVIGVLMILYSEGAQAKTRALADSLGQRLSDIIAFNVNIKEIRGLDKTFEHYRELNPDISAAGLTINGIVEIHTEKNLIGQPWITDGRNYEYGVDLTSDRGLRNIRVVVALPVEIVLRQMLRSVKNFAALFVASAFLAGVFLQLGRSMHRLHLQRDNSQLGGTNPLAADAALNLVKPVFFGAVFLEHLNYAFLPQFVDQVVLTSGLSTAYVSTPFVAYYLWFALVLIPAGHFAQHVSPRPLMYVGLLLAGISFMLLVVQPDFVLVTVARSLSGIGQGMLFIGVQSYTLLVAPPGKKTQSAGIIVLGFQGGMISGMAVGSLLVTQLGPSGVFSLSGIIGFFLAIYAALSVPAQAWKSQAATGLGISWRQLVGSLTQVLRNVQFLKTMFLIGIPAKAVLTGVIIFALPLLLTQLQYKQEDIGQIIMIYAATVILSNRYVTRLVDRTGRTSSVLCWGATLSGVGLILIGSIGWGGFVGDPDNWFLVTLVLIGGVALVGVAHGFINAPVVTHVADSALALKIGESPATASYRFLERIGHVAGPIIIGQLFFYGGLDPALLSWIGAGTIILGLLFLIGNPSKNFVTTNVGVQT